MGYFDIITRLARERDEALDSKNDSAETLAAAVLNLLTDMGHKWTCQGDRTKTVLAAVSAAVAETHTSGDGE